MGSGLSTNQKLSFVSKQRGGRLQGTGVLRGTLEGPKDTRGKWSRFTGVGAREGEEAPLGAHPIFVDRGAGLFSRIPLLLLPLIQCLAHLVRIPFFSAAKRG